MAKSKWFKFTTIRGTDSILKLKHLNQDNLGMFWYTLIYVNIEIIITKQITVAIKVYFLYIEWVKILLQIMSVFNYKKFYSEISDKNYDNSYWSEFKLICT